jgi:hypothetical protein
MVCETGFCGNPQIRIDNFKLSDKEKFMKKS